MRDFLKSLSDATVKEVAGCEFPLVHPDVNTEAREMSGEFADRAYLRGYGREKSALASWPFATIARRDEGNGEGLRPHRALKAILAVTSKWHLSTVRIGTHAPQASSASRVTVCAVATAGAFAGMSLLRLSLP